MLTALRRCESHTAATYPSERVPIFDRRIEASPNIGSHPCALYRSNHNTAKKVTVNPKPACLFEWTILALITGGRIDLRCHPKMRFISCTGWRHIGHCVMFSVAQPSHTHLCPHGMIAITASPSRQTTHSEPLLIDTAVKTSCKLVCIAADDDVYRWNIRPVLRLLLSAVSK